MASHVSKLEFFVNIFHDGNFLGGGSSQSGSVGREGAFLGIVAINPLALHIVVDDLDAVKNELVGTIDQRLGVIDNVVPESVYMSKTIMIWRKGNSHTS